MNKILEYVKEVGSFCPPEYIGAYDGLPFTHEEYNDYVYELFNYLDKSYRSFDDDILVEIMPFTVEDDHFVLRHVAMGQEVFILTTKKYHLETWPEENV